MSVILTPQALTIRAMKKAGASQTDFARKFKVDRSAVNHWINGRTFPIDRAIRAMCKITGDDPEKVIIVREYLRITQRMRRMGYDMVLLKEMMAA